VRLFFATHKSISQSVDSVHGTLIFVCDEHNLDLVALATIFIMTHPGYQEMRVFETMSYSRFSMYRYATPFLAISFLACRGPIASTDHSIGFQQGLRANGRDLKGSKAPKMSKAPQGSSAPKKSKAPQGTSAPKKSKGPKGGSARLLRQSGRDLKGTKAPTRTGSKSPTKSKAHQGTGAPKTSKGPKGGGARLLRQFGRDLKGTKAPTNTSSKSPKKSKTPQGTKAPKKSKGPKGGGARL
jgi:hypothetical protein